MTLTRNNPALDCLKSAIEERGLTQEEISAIMGRAQPTISDILNGKRVISADLAVDFELALPGKINAEKLLNLQSKFLVEQARLESKDSEVRLKAKLQEEFPIKELEKRGWINTYKNLDSKIKAVLEFSENSSDLDSIKQPFTSALARQSRTLGYLSPSGKATRAWLFRVKELARITPAREFDHQRFVNEGLDEIRALARNAKDVAQVPQTLARYGIRFLVVAHLQKTRLEGCALWLDEENTSLPVIALTMRFGGINNFWFNLAHELHHIKYKHSFSLNLEKGESDDEYNDPVDLQIIEDQANAGGAEWLTPQKRFDAFIKRHKGRFNNSNICAFAELINVHPGIVVGALQFRDELPYSSLLNKLKEDVRPKVLLASMADGFDLPIIKTQRTNNQ